VRLAQCPRRHHQLGRTAARCGLGHHLLAADLAARVAIPGERAHFLFSEKPKSNRSNLASVYVGRCQFLLPTVESQSRICVLRGLIHHVTR
jgi:hypothetical protein